MENATKKNTGARYDFIDLVKFVLSFMIVALHNNLFSDKIYPWVRVAVPLFFIISAYFIFVKLAKCKSNEEKSRCVKKYVIRNLQLYLFWTAVQLPIFVYTKFDWNGLWYIGTLEYLKRILVGEGFTAAWFILATAAAVLLIHFASKKLGNKTLLAISALIYGVVVVKSSYPNLIEQVPALNAPFYLYGKYIVSPIFSVPAALFWAMLGKCFGEEQIPLKKIPAIIGGGLSAVALFFEWRYVYNATGVYNSDCLFSLMPLCLFLFALILAYKSLPVPGAVTLRKLSTLIYVTHGASGVICKFILKKIYPTAHEALVYLCIIAACIAVGLVIIKLKKYTKLLKYAL